MFVIHRWRRVPEEKNYNSAWTLTRKRKVFVPYNCRRREGIFWISASGYVTLYVLHSRSTRSTKQVQKQYTQFATSDKFTGRDENMKMRTTYLHPQLRLPLDIQESDDCFLASIDTAMMGRRVQRNLKILSVFDQLEHQGNSFPQHFFVLPKRLMRAERRYL